MRYIALAATVIVGLASWTWAWTEPRAFQGVPWGASVDETRVILTARTTVPSEAFCYGPVCVWDTTVGTVPARVSFEFEDNRLVRGIVRFDPKDYPAMRRLLVERHGAPTDRQERPGGAGSEPSDARLAWHGDRVVIVLERREAGGNVGRATVVLREALDRQAASRDRAPAGR